MIIVRPNHCDWNHIFAITGDESWKASHMQGYFERIERCRYRFFLWRWLAAATGLNPTGHGWWGWMTTERALPLRVLRDWPLWRALLRCVGAAADAFGKRGSDWETTETFLTQVFDDPIGDTWHYVRCFIATKRCEVAPTP